MIFMYLDLMIRRLPAEKAVLRALRNSPVVALLGPRQCGKTTLAKALARKRDAAYFDLEDPPDLKRLEHPKTALESLEGLVVLDEIQRMPKLLELLRVLADRPGRKTRFLILGSASPHLVRGTSESLAGRVQFVDLGGFTLEETGARHHDRLWLRGGFPNSFQASTEDESLRWRNAFMRTFLERDMPSLGFPVPAATLRRFWSMLAHYHGQTWNAAEFARSLGSTERTARHYLDLLDGTFMVRQILPWFENLGKRQVKAPKIYIRDSGILHALLGIRTRRDLTGHPKLGASWEGFAIEQALALEGTRNAYFWGTHGGAELDLFLFLKGGKRVGLEMKYGDAPGMTKSMHSALEDLRLDRLWVVYPGDRRYPLEKNVEVIPLKALGEALG